MIDLQLSKMDAAHQESQPSHINLILNTDVDLSVLEEIKALPGVAGVDTMSQLTVFFRSTPESLWTMATLIIRPDYARQRYDKTLLETGAWPSQNQLAIENLSAQFTGLSLGDRIEFKTAGDSLILPIKGIVRHPFVKPPKFGGQVHFFAATSDGLSFNIRPNSFRQLLVQVAPPYNEDQARTMAGKIRALLAQHHVATAVTLLQDPQRHWGRPFLAGVNGVLKLMALTSLALASILIFNTVSAHLALQRNQIGVMKALGASTGTIVKIYLGETLLMALMATLLALPLGLAAAYFSSCQLLGLFNINCGDFDFSSRAVLYMLFGGLLLPLLAATSPIIRSATMTVRVAIADHGLGADFGYSRFDVLLERFAARFLPTLYAAAFCNLFRRKASLVLTQSVLIIAGTTFLVLMSLITSLNLTLDNEMARSQFAIRLGFTVDQTEQQLLEITNSVPAIENVEFWQRLPVELVKDGKSLRQKGNLGAQLLAIPSRSAMYQPLIESGRWLQASDAGQRYLVVSADTARLNGIQVGTTLEATIDSVKQNWQIIGIYRWLVAGNYVVEPVYASLEAVRTIIQDKNKASFALLKASIANREKEADLLSLLKQRFQENNIKLDVYNTQAKLEQNQFIRNQFNPVLGTLWGLASMIAAVGGIGLSGALAISVMQRTREIGVLSAIGASSRTIYRLFLLEGLLHGLVAWVLSIPIAYLAAEPIARELGKTMLGIELDFSFDVKAVFYWLGIVLLLTWIASYWPARKASKLTVRECLQH
jgi:putative ABC transport system permease protein